MHQFDRQDLKNLEKLARIRCTSEEEDALFENIQKILNYVDQLSSVDTKGVEPCDYVSQIQQASVFREDTPEDVLSSEAFLKNAPDHIGSLIRTPPVIEQ